MEPMASQYIRGKTHKYLVNLYDVGVENEKQLIIFQDPFLALSL